MYLSYYNLKHKPFQISTDPGFLWLGEKHMEALATLRYGVLDNKGFLLLTGDVGTGKTTLINALLKTLGDNVLVATIRDPDLTPTDFFHYTAHVFGLKKEITSKSFFLIHFEKFLSDAYDHKKKVLLIIDEAQRINQKLLEEVRLLSNIEKNESKLLNIFFVGQIEFNDILLLPVNRPIRQRITVNYNIETLSEEETEHYIRHRLSIARQGIEPSLPDPDNKSAPATFTQERLTSPSSKAGKNVNVFTDGAIREIYLFSNGYPRLINIICDRSLLTGYVEESKMILPKHVKECAKELEIPYFGLIQHSSQNTDLTPSPRKKRYPQLGPRDSAAVDIQPITELPIQNAIQEDSSEHPRMKKPEIQEIPKSHGKTKSRKTTKRLTTIYLMTCAAILTVLLIGYFSMRQDSRFSMYITDTLKNSSLAESAARIRQSLDAVMEKFAIEHSSAQYLETQTDSRETPLSENVTTAEVPSTADTDSRNSTILGKLIMPFPPEATLPPSTSLVNLNMLIESIPSQKPYKVIISGYTDTQKDEKRNVKLSEAKAHAIKIYLISRGLEETQIETRGLGSQFPITPNITTSDKEANHRVEVEFRR
jgi:general secretion pathway protein A